MPVPKGMKGEPKGMKGEYSDVGTRADDDEDHGEDEDEGVDLTQHEVDLYELLKLKRDESAEANTKGLISRARAGFHRQSTKWHPRNFHANHVVCDECGAHLALARDWFHHGGELYDLCRADWEQQAPDEREKFCNVTELDDLGAERERYSAALEAVAARAAAELRFRQIGLAWRVIKDEPLRSIYLACGWSGLVKSESYAEASVFEADFFAAYEAFFAGEDEEDRQYLLLGGSAKLSDEEDESEAEAGGEGKRDGKGDMEGENEEEEEEDEEEEEEEDDEEALLAAAADKTNADAAGAVAREQPPPPLPRPPAMVAMQMAPKSREEAEARAGAGFAPPGGDPWALVSRKVAHVGGDTGGDSTAGEESPATKRARAEGSD